MQVCLDRDGVRNGLHSSYAPFFAALAIGPSSAGYCADTACAPSCSAATACFLCTGIQHGCTFVRLDSVAVRSSACFGCTVHVILCVAYRARVSLRGPATKLTPHEDAACVAKANAAVRPAHSAALYCCQSKAHMTDDLLRVCARVCTHARMRA